MTRIVNKENIVLVTTGGTIEKTYNESDGSLSNRDSIIKDQILKRLRLPYTNLQVFNIINKDSLHFTDYDRALLAKTLTVQSEKGHPIVVLHGTDTMARSAEYCEQTMKHINVPIVFTGAMVPLGFIDSDAGQNVTEALLASKILAPGVYICFHNRIFSVPGTRKNMITRTFEEVKK